MSGNNRLRRLSTCILFLSAKRAYGRSHSKNKHLFMHIVHITLQHHYKFYFKGIRTDWSFWSNVLYEKNNQNKTYEHNMQIQCSTKGVGWTGCKNGCPQLNYLASRHRNMLTKTNLESSCSLSHIVIGTDQLHLYYTNKMDNLVLLPYYFNGPLTIPAPCLSLIPVEPIHF